MALISYEGKMGEGMTHKSWAELYRNRKKYKPRICDSKTGKMRPFTKKEWNELLGHDIVSTDIFTVERNNRIEATKKTLRRK